MAENLTVIDHHASNQELLKNTQGLEEVIFDLNYSGAGLTERWLAGFDPEMPLSTIVTYVQDRDLWRFDLVHSKEINALIAATPMTWQNWDRIATQMNVDLTRVVEQGGLLLEMQRKQIDDLVKNQYVAGIAVYSVPMVNASVHFSEVADALLEEHPDAPFAATYRDLPELRVFSLRSRGFDVSEVAKLFGGGGHVRAAGFQMPRPKMPEISSARPSGSVSVRSG